MGLGDALLESARVASDYLNNGKGKQGAYAAVRNARSREAERDKETAAAKATPASDEVDTQRAAAKPSPIMYDATPHVAGGAEIV